MVDKGNFNSAVELLGELEKQRSLHPSELVRKGRYIQLGTEESLPLEEADRSYRTALAIDPEYLPAIIELAWFQFAVQDDAAQGLELFEQAITLLRKKLTEAIDGKNQCERELEDLET